MKDIFDIIENRKDKHIKIKGEISEYSLCYDMDVVNDFYLILLDNTDHMDVTTFNINENNAYTDINVYDITISAQRSTYSSIEFDIDIYVDNYLWRELSDFEDFIDYYTVGAIKYDNKYTSNLIIDELEEYMSRRVLHRDLDADGDAVFAAEFRPTDMSNMFRNASIDLSRLD